MKVKHPLYTIGYEGAHAEALARTLREQGVKILLDVRAVPLSRKPGFSKNKLAGHLAQEDITYIGLKALGTPPEGRAAARKHNKAELVRIFSAHLETIEAQAALHEAIKIAQSAPVCLLCFEHSPTCCHRLLVAESIIKETGQEIVHLYP